MSPEGEAVTTKLEPVVVELERCTTGVVPPARGRGSVEGESLADGGEDAEVDVDPSQMDGGSASLCGEPVAADVEAKVPGAEPASPDGDPATSDVESRIPDADPATSDTDSPETDGEPSSVAGGTTSREGSSAAPVRRAAGGRHRRPEPPRPPWAARPRLLGAVAVAVAVAAAAVALIVPSALAGLRDEPPAAPANSAASPPAVSGESSPSPAPSTSAYAPTLAAGPVAVDFDGFLSWALLDGAGRISGSGNVAATTTAGSLLRIWIVSDYLRRTAAQGRQPTATRLAQARRAIRDADADATQALFAAGGGAAQIRRMMSICRLSDTRADPSRWSRTRISARDAARLGGCVADGRAAGPAWTRWVRAEMTNVNGGSRADGQPTGGRWGIVGGLPDRIIADGVGIQNGWIVGPGGNWQVNCLAVADGWSLAVLLRYPAERGLRFGAETCAKVASQLVTRPSPTT